MKNHRSPENPSLEAALNHLFRPKSIAKKIYFGGEVVLNGGITPPVDGKGADKGWFDGELVPESIPGAKGAGALTDGPDADGVAAGTGSGAGAGLADGEGNAGGRVDGATGGTRLGVVAIGFGTTDSDGEAPDELGVGAGSVAPGGTTETGGVDEWERPGTTGAGKMAECGDSGISPIGVWCTFGKKGITPEPRGCVPAANRILTSFSISKACPDSRRNCAVKRSLSVVGITFHGRTRM
jgi:hypothetical protein